jgi:hypothetical protein
MSFLRVHHFIPEILLIVKIFLRHALPFAAGKSYKCLPQTDRAITHKFG